jgi:hypothetical protein
MKLEGTLCGAPIWGLLGWLALLPAACLAQTSSSSESFPLKSFEPPKSADQTPFEKKAGKAVHGSDLEGKDGPMAKLGMDLALLYYRSREYGPDMLDQKYGGQVGNGYFSFDAVVSGKHASAAEAFFSGIGGRNLSRSGQVVSGYLPIEQIPRIVDAKHLRSIRLASIERRSAEQRALEQKPEELRSASNLSGTATQTGVDQSLGEDSPETSYRPASVGEAPSPSSSSGVGTGVILLIGTALLIEFS